MLKIWHDDAWDDYLYWQSQDKKTLKKVNNLIKDIERSPFEGIGKPEALRHGYIIRCSEYIKQNISHLKIPQFLEETHKITSEFYLALHKNKFCAIISGDTRQHAPVISRSFAVMKIFKGHGFKLKELSIKEQLKEKETIKFITNAFRDGTMKITGIDIDNTLPSMSRFASADSGQKRTEKNKECLISSLPFLKNTLAWCRGKISTY